jgi:hypothetical protein
MIHERASALRYACIAYLVLTGFYIEFYCHVLLHIAWALVLSLFYLLFLSTFAVFVIGHRAVESARK